jgi:hypothetical protein
MMRDARINTIGEGANDVLRTFIALVGVRDVGLELKGVLDAVKSPLGGLGKITDFARRHLPGQDRVHVPLRHAELADLGHLLEDLTRTFGHAVEQQLMRYREAILEKQLVQARIADAATDLYMMSAVVARLDALLAFSGEGVSRDVKVGRYFCHLAERRIRASLAHLHDDLDDETMDVASTLLQ